MSATVAAALKKISAGLLSEPKVFKKVVSVILVLLIAVLTPIMAVVAVLNSDIEIDSGDLENLISEQQKAQLAQMQSTMNSIESRMTDAGYASRAQEAQVLYVLALSDRTSDSGFIEKLVGCFSDNQTDEQLVNSVTPDSTEWICYDNPSDEVKYSSFNLEQEMFSVLNSAVERYGLSYTECNFQILNAGVKPAK